MINLATNLPKAPCMAALKEKFGKRLAEELKLRGWTNAYFAERIGTSPSNVTLWIKGTTSPRDFDVLQKIADELGVEAYALLKDGPAEATSEKPPRDDQVVIRVLEQFGYAKPKRLRKKDA